MPGFANMKIRQDKCFLLLPEQSPPAGEEEVVVQDDVGEGEWFKIVQGVQVV
jgi:hypothetical protein